MAAEGSRMDHSTEDDDEKFLFNRMPEERVIDGEQWTVVGYGDRGNAVMVDSQTRRRRILPMNSGREIVDESLEGSEGHGGYGASATVHRASEALCDVLNGAVDAYGKSRDPIFHPFSDRIILDHLHPSLYSVEKESGHQYKWQWPASVLRVSSDGGAFSAAWNSKTLLDDTIAGDALARGLELFAEEALPYLLSASEVYHAMSSYDDDDDDDRFVEVPDLGAVSDCPVEELLVYPKVVDMVIQPGQTYAGVWHTEGIPSERIVATAVLYPRVDEGIEGGYVQFKRPFLYDSYGEYHEDRYDRETVRYIRNGIDNLGTVATRQGTMLVFPNTYYHRLLHVHNPTDKTLVRRLVVLFLADPAVTRKDLPLTEPDVLPSLEEGLRRQLLVMEERRQAKSRIAGRKTNMCEH